MKVLVTGGTGFTGSHTVRSLVACGHEIRLLVRDADKARRVFEPHGFVPDDLVVGDMTDASAVEGALRGCDGVLHAAALVDLRRAAARRVEESNVRGVELVVVPTRAFVSTDPAFLRRILQNLLSNALRYGKAEGRPARVLLGCRRVGEELRIEVKDNGPGIAVDKQAVIFDEFVRLQAEDDAPREERGLGLGLAIVDRIARMLDLTVELASSPGQGSTFSVTVPRVAAVVSAPMSPPAPQPTPSVEAESFVLCIDNEARVREAMATLLSGWGCRVATAATQAEALEVIARVARLPDLVLADLHLDEGPDGLDVVDALRRAWDRVVPAALITADRDPMLRLRARARQVELLHKPVKPAALRALLRLRAATAAGRLTA